MEIKKLTKKDYLQIVELEKQLFDSPFSSNSVLEELNLENRIYLGVFDLDILVGYVGAMVTFDSADIIKIGVAKSEQQKGYATILLKTLIEKLKQINVKKIVLEVEHQNFKAINLYTKFGFKEISIRQNYYGLNSHAKIFELEI